MRYALIDSGHQKKLEQFGSVTLIRPCAQALWKPSRSDWTADATFSRDGKKGWDGEAPDLWISEHEGIKFRLSPTDFGHVGIFPEHSFLWKWAKDQVKPGSQILNLFAYSGAATLALAKADAEVCHVDASQGMVNWARGNATLNGLQERPIRWIVDDILKFLKREVQRGRMYDGILLDPPSFGRGAKGELFKIERDIHKLLTLSKQLLSNSPLFVICSNHTNIFTPTVMHHLFDEVFRGHIEVGELLLKAEKGRDIPSGTYAKWTP
jgi:23S rRNA (cytosine1962-C5)-methyltransferase